MRTPFISDEIIDDINKVKNLLRKCPCVHCSKDYFSSYRHIFRVDWNVDWEKCKALNWEDYIFYLVLTQCELCSNAWLEICLVLILLFIVWMIFMPFSKDRFLLVLTVFHAAVCTLLWTWKLISLWILAASMVVFISRLGMRSISRHNLFTIFVFYLQTMMALFVSQIEDLKEIMGNNRIVKPFVNVVEKIANLKGFQLRCWFGDFYDELILKLTFVALLPVLVSCFSWVAFAFWYMIMIIRKESTDHFSLIRSRCAAFGLSFFNFAYLPILNQAFLLIFPSCQQVTPWTSIMKNYLWVNCGSEEEIRVRNIAIIVAAIYISIPFVVFLPLLYKHRVQISNETDKSNASLWFSSIYLPYKPNYRAFMHIIVLIKKILFALILSIQSSELLLAQCVLVTIFVFCKMRPFMVNNDRRCCITLITAEVGTDNFFEIGFLFAIFNTCIFKRSFIEKKNDVGRGIEFVFFFFVSAAANAVILLLFLYFIVRLFCCCKRREDANNHSTVAFNSDLSNKYGSVSNQYVLKKASSFDDSNLP